MSSRNKSSLLFSLPASAHIKHDSYLNIVSLHSLLSYAFRTSRNPHTNFICLPGSMHVSPSKTTISWLKTLRGRFQSLQRPSFLTFMHLFLHTYHHCCIYICRSSRQTRHRACRPTISRTEPRAPQQICLHAARESKMKSFRFSQVPKTPMLRPFL